MEKTRGNGYKLHQETGFISLQGRLVFLLFWGLGLFFFFTARTIIRWNSLPRDVARVPIAGGFQDAIGQGAR